MESSQEPIGTRVSKLNSLVIGPPRKTERLCDLVARETLLDALQALYDECNLEAMRKYDRQIAQFVEKHKVSMHELKKLRVNITDFDIKAVIGRGHFGEVHMVKEKQTGDVYAMKKIRKADSVEKTSFNVERDIMAFSNSCWLTSLQYAFQDSTYLFFVMEYHPGGDLLGLLYRQGGTLPESAATFYIAELLVALEDLHSMGYVHRDVKPENVLLDRCGHVKLADFGSAAKLNDRGVVEKSMPVGTPDYVAPEVLQSIEGRSPRKSGYGISCDYWSVGVLAYELTIGKTPFHSQQTTGTYSRIMNFSNNLKFPSDVLLTQSYVSLVRGLISDQKTRMNREQIRGHELFADVDFDSLREQVPPHVPKIASADDTSNFSDVAEKRQAGPVFDSFKKRTQFSGRNLPFVGFTFTQDHGGYPDHTEVTPSDHGDGHPKPSVHNNNNNRDEMLIKHLKAELQEIRTRNEELNQNKIMLERGVFEKEKKIEMVENLRADAEQRLTASIADCMAAKRTLDIERKDRAELERRALELIKSAKLKWEASERNKVEALRLEIEQQKEKIDQLTTTNTMLNDQLQKALKIKDDRHQEYVDPMEKLARRSVLGLEARLERLSTESRTLLTNLQTTLHEETEKRQLTEKQLDTAKNDNLKLLEKLKRTEEDYKNLKTKVTESDGLVRELNRRVNEMEADLQTVATSKEQIDRLEKEIHEYRMTIGELEKKNSKLAAENEAIEDLKGELDDMKQLEVQTDRKLSELENKLLQEQEKSARLRSDLTQKENASNESQELREMRTKLYRAEKDLSNCKIDKRILERELKEAQNRVKELTEEIEKLTGQLNDGKKIHESAMLELSNINESLSLELMRLREAHKTLNSRLENEKEKYLTEKTVMVELKEVIRSKDLKIDDLNDRVKALTTEKASAEKRCASLEAEKSRLVDQLNKAKNEHQQLRYEYDNTVQQLNDTRLNMEEFKKACLEIENQVIEFENALVAVRAEKSALTQNVDKLVSDLCQARHDIQEARKSTNEEKSLRLLAEAKINRLQEEAQSLREECDSHENQATAYRQLSNELSEQLRQSETAFLAAQGTIDKRERDIKELKADIQTLKVDLSHTLTQMSRWKECNTALRQEVKDLKKARQDLIDQVDELKRSMEAKRRQHELKEHRSTVKIEQLEKLIGWLQHKDLGQNKKRTLADKLFGHSKKENVPLLPVTNRELELQVDKHRETIKNLQEEIYRLKAELSLKDGATPNKSMQRRNKARRSNSDGETSHSKMAIHQLITKSPTEMPMATRSSVKRSSSGLKRMSSFQRMSHNIPHRFETKIAGKHQKCDHCQNKISLGKSFRSCTECKLDAHSHCSALLIGTCGLPLEFAKRYNDTFGKIGYQDEIVDADSSENDRSVVINIEGWIKLLSNGSWEKRYACLTDAHLVIYDAPPSRDGSTGGGGKKLSSCELRSTEGGGGGGGHKGKVVLEPLPSEFGEHNFTIASSDLPFVLKIEMPREDAKCWPPKTLFFMALSLDDRDKWYAALQQVFNEYSSDKYNMATVTPLPKDLQPELNHVLDLTKRIKILCTERGLYALHDNALVPIEGITDVTRAAILNNHVIMIAGPEAGLVWCDLNHLLNLAQCASFSRPTLHYKPIKMSVVGGGGGSEGEGAEAEASTGERTSMTGRFQFLHTSDSVDSGTQQRQMFCAATAKQLAIVQFNLDAGDFEVLRIMDTAEAVSCALFTDYTLIVGADKFFEIDLSTFEAEEFLDNSDPNLAHVVTCYKIGSFPIAVKKISNDPKEYLLCFNELSVFVDEFGHSSRGATEIKTNNIPITVEFIKNYLYVVHFGGVEIIKFRINRTFAETNVDLKNVRYLGCHRRSAGIYLLHDGSIKLLEGRRTFDPDEGDDDDQLSLSTVDSVVTMATASDVQNNSASTGNDGDFSLTSSIVASLDGQLSDNEEGGDEAIADAALQSNPTGVKRVQFCRVSQL